MKRMSWQTWGIGQRISLVTLTPVVLMFIAMVTYLAFSYFVEVRDQLGERGNAMVSAIARSSEYGVVTGNRSDLARTARDTMRTDPNIVSIRILDANKHVLINVPEHDTDGMTKGDKTFRAPIVLDSNASNSVASRDHDGIETKSDRNITQAEVIGYAEIAMSSDRILDKQWHRIIVGALITSIALICSGVLGLYLARSVTGPLAQTSAVLREIRSGNYDVQFHPLAGGEIGDLQSIIQNMAFNLREFRKDLEAKVVARTRDLVETRDKYVRANMEKKILIEKLNSIAEEERKNIAVELHDELNASLIVVRLEAQRIVSLSNNVPSSPTIEEIRTLARSVTKHTSDLYSLARGIVKRLRPEIIDTMGLRDALEEIVRHYDEIHPDCRFEFLATQDFSTLKVEYAITAYRLVQEALSNVVKHSRATYCQVRLRRSESRNMLRIHVRDDGIGFEFQSKDGGIGLIGMRERVHSVGGKFRMFRKADRGTAIVIELPYLEKKTEQHPAPNPMMTERDTDDIPKF